MPPLNWLSIKNVAMHKQSSRKEISQICYGIEIVDLFQCLCGYTAMQQNYSVGRNARQHIAASSVQGAEKLS
jgi:hypothetical protein